ncbi:MAG: hypothetical protein U1F41_06190 [Burkholderiales bacterium]
METLAPELSRPWLAEKDGLPGDANRASKEEDAGAVAAAMEALANLVSAARSIV